jgi:hypothetical protein
LAGWQCPEDLRGPPHERGSRQSGFKESGISVQSFTAPLYCRDSVMPCKLRLRRGSSSHTIFFSRSKPVPRDLLRRDWDRAGGSLTSTSSSSSKLPLPVSEVPPASLSGPSLSGIATSTPSQGRLGCAQGLQNLKATQAPDDDDANTGTVLDEMRTLSNYSATNLRARVHIFIG